MGKKWVVCGVVAGLVIGTCFSAAASDDNSRVTNPNAFVAEAFGRGMIWSVQYDRVIAELLSGGIGFSMIGASNGNIATMIPFFLSFYFMKSGSSIYLTAGANIIPNATAVAGSTSVAGNLTFATFPMVANVGFGYENRSDAGFLIRATVYGMYAVSIIPWFGISFGYSF